MAVIDKMVKSGCDAFNDLLTEGEDNCPIQVAINAAWIDFDPNDESTWGFENGVQYMLLCEEGIIRFQTMDEDDTQATFARRLYMFEATRYADPEHFRYEEG